MTDKLDLKNPSKSKELTVLKTSTLMDPLQ